MTAIANTRNPTLSEAVRALGRPRVALIFAQGFSSGLPFLLVGNTFGYWLRDEGTTLKAIGFISWVGLAYVLKPFWAVNVTGTVTELDCPAGGRGMVIAFVSRPSVKSLIFTVKLAIFCWALFSRLSSRKREALSGIHSSTCTRRMMDPGQLLRNFRDDNRQACAKLSEWGNAATSSTSWRRSLSAHSTPA